MSCAHITAALIQVSIVMSNLQDSHTTEGKDDPALTTAGQGVQSLWGQ